MTDCRLCDAPSLAADESGLARIIAFPTPQFDGHAVVMTTAHRGRLEDVTTEEWRAVGSLVSKFAAETRAETDAERFYLLLIGDVDDHQLHMHLVPRYGDDPALGPYVFGAEGWNAGRPPPSRGRD